MKFFLIFALFFATLTLSAQNISLQHFEKTLDNPENKDYYQALGFELVESQKEGNNGKFEKWVLKDSQLYLSVQHNDVFGFTKLMLTTTAEASKDIISQLTQEIKKTYESKVFEEAKYFIKDPDSKTTVHLIKLAKDGLVVDGIMFFRKS